MGFFCLSLLQWTTKSKKARHAATTLYNIQKSVLDKLGTLTSDVGDMETARKLEASSTLRPHTENEVRWIETAVQALIRRKAAYDADPSSPLPLLGMSDLPPI